MGVSVNGISCDFCRQPISNMVLKFRHEVSNSNFMVGLLDVKEEMCDICYSRAKAQPPSKDEIDERNQCRSGEAERMRAEISRL